jgi:hypothetical protein
VVRPSKYEVEGIDIKSKVEVVRPGKEKFKDIDNNLKVEVARSSKVKEVNRQEIDGRACGNRLKIK